MPHYLGGKLGRSSSLGPSFPPSAVPSLFPGRYPAAPALDLLISILRVKKRASVPSAVCPSSSLFLPFTHTLLRPLYSPPQDRISFHPRSSSVTSSLRTDRRLQPLSPTLLPAATILPDAPPPQFSVSLEQRERVTIYSGDLRDRGSRPPCPRALTSLTLSLSLFPPHPVPLPNAVPSIGPVFDFSPHPAAVPTTLSSRSYTLQLRYLCPGPANKHMNARAFSRTHTRVRAEAFRPQTRSSLSLAFRLFLSEHCLVLLTASGTIYLGCSRWIPFRSLTSWRRERVDTSGITRHRDLRMRRCVHANARPRFCRILAPYFIFRISSLFLSPPLMLQPRMPSRY